MSEVIGGAYELAKYDEMRNRREMTIKLLCDGYAPKTVAARVGISERQIREWNKDKAFLKDRYTEMTMRMGEIAGEALNVLRQVMNNPEEKGVARVKAATEVLDRAGFVVNKEISLTLNEGAEKGNLLSRMSDEEIVNMLTLVQGMATAVDVTPESVEVIEEKKGEEDNGTDGL